MQQSVKTGKIYRQVNWELESLGSRSMLLASRIQGVNWGDIYLILQSLVCLCSAGTDQSLSALQELFE